jgi:hypothetical protein
MVIGGWDDETVSLSQKFETFPPILQSGRKSEKRRETEQRDFCEVYVMIWHKNPANRRYFRADQVPVI